MFKLDIEKMSLVTSSGIPEALGNLLTGLAWDPDIDDLMTVVDEAESASDLFDDFSMMHLLRKPTRFTENDRQIRIAFVDVFGNRSYLKISKC